MIIIAFYLGGGYFIQNGIEHICVRQRRDYPDSINTMQRTLTKPFAACIATALLIACMPFAFAQAHGDEDHSATPTAAVQPTKSVAELEQMLALLQKLIALLQEQKALGGTTVIPKAVVAPAAEHDEAGGHTEAGGHDETGDASKDDMKTFAIEIETHDGKTHIHARFVDRPEQQFFIDQDIKDEAGIIKELEKRFSMPASVIKPAIVYTGL